MFAYLWQRKGKINGFFKNSTSVVLQQYQNILSIQRTGSYIALKFSLPFLKGRQCSLMKRQQKLDAKPLKRFNKKFNTTLEPLLGKLSLFCHCWRTTEMMFLEQPLISPFSAEKQQPYVRLTQARPQILRSHLRKLTP